MEGEMQLMVLLKGHPGSGKSTLGRQLAQALRWPLVDKDDVRDELQCASSRMTAAAFADLDANRLAYGVMFRTAATQLSLGMSAIVDCPLARRELFDTASDIAAKHGARVIVLECLASDEAEWCRRLEARAAVEGDTSASHKPQSWQDLQTLLHRYNGCWRWSREDALDNCVWYLLLDTTANSKEDVAEKALKFIRQAAASSLSSDYAVRT